MGTDSRDRDAKYAPCPTRQSPMWAAAAPTDKMKGWKILSLVLVVVSVCLTVGISVLGYFYRRDTQSLAAQNLTECQGQFLDVRSDLQGQLTRLREEKHALQQNLTAWEGDLSRLRDQGTEKEAERSKLQGEVDRLQKQLSDDAQESKHQLQEKSNRIKQLENQLNRPSGGVGLGPSVWVLLVLSLSGPLLV